MLRRFATAAAALSGALVVTLGFAGSSGALQLGGGTAAYQFTHIGQRLVRTNTDRALPLHGGSVSSSNWSGYAVTPGSANVTAVSTSFLVPAAGAVPPGFGATWTGIGGYSSSDLIQAGVAETSFPGNPALGEQYYAWYEMLPGAAVPLTNCHGDANCTVNPGDDIGVRIYQTSNDVWTIALLDLGHWTWTATGVHYASTHSSAEWILEAPQVDGLPTTMSSDGTVKFGPYSFYVLGHQKIPHTIGIGDPTTIDLSPVGVVNEATPSTLARDGRTFDDCTYAQSCATP
jgi:hypothetical protein